MKPLFQEAHEPHSDDDRDHVALVAHQRDFIEAEEHRLIGVHTLGGHRPGVLEIGV